MAADPSNVRVALRVRPLIARELAEGVCLTQPDATVPQVSLGKHAFAFDFVFAPGSAQRAVFDAAVAPLLAAFLEGFNACVFAYGQTGSGKTHTMGSGAPPSGPDAAAEGGRDLLRQEETRLAFVLEQRQHLAGGSPAEHDGPAVVPPVIADDRVLLVQAAVEVQEEVRRGGVVVRGDLEADVGRGHRG
jgi:hypothetical protein